MGTYEIKHSTPAAAEAMLQFIYIGTYNVPDDQLCAMFSLSVLYELKDLMRATASDMLTGVSQDNVQERVKLLKLHKEHVKDEWESMLDMLQSERSLLEAACPP